MYSQGWDNVLLVYSLRCGCEFAAMIFTSPTLKNMMSRRTGTFSLMADL